MSAPRLADVLRTGIQLLTQAGIAGAAGDARILLAYAANIPLDRLTLHLQDKISEGVDVSFSAYIHARAAHQPVAQIIGRRMFWGRDFIVTKDTLDPRPETETLIAGALRAPFARVLDLGTGTGCILLTLLAERPDALGVGADLSQAALDVAARNARALGVENRARLVQSDWFSSVDGQFDLIVSNPPYIALDEMAQLSPDVRAHEPHLALTDGGDGLSAYRIIAAQAGAYLNAGGRVLLEIGPTQGAPVSALLAAQGFSQIHVLPDFDGRDRVVLAQAAAQ